MDLFRQLLRDKYNGNHNPPTADGAPPPDVPADRLRGGRPEQPNIVSKWKRLEQLPPGSQEYLILLTFLLDSPVDRKATTALRGEDATVVLDILARVLARGKNLGRLSNRTLGVLRRLGYNACQVPTNYKVDRSLGFNVDPTIIASGGFSDVRKGTLGGQLVAVKVLRMSLESNVSEIQKHFCKETILWKNISHSNILGLIAVEIDSDTRKCSMISELMVKGNITHFIRSTPTNRLRLLADTAEGLQHLHGRNIVHGDIKGANILVKNGTPPRACLSDFGFSILTSTSVVMSTQGMNLSGGTPSYMAPELIYPSKFGLTRSRLSKEGDIYALGMVVYEVVTGVRPFGLENLRAQEVMCAVLDGKRPIKPGNADAIGFGRGVWDLVEGCWTEDRMKRPKIGYVRRRLAIAAFVSSAVPSGLAAVPVTREETSTGSMESSIIPSGLFNNPYQPATSADPERGGGDDRQDTGSILERSIYIARQVVDGIQASIPPTVREKFGMVDRLHLRNAVNDFRARFDF